MINRTTNQVEFFPMPQTMARPSWASDDSETGTRVRDEALNLTWSGHSVNIETIDDDGNVRDDQSAEIVQEIYFTGEGIEVHQPVITVFLDDGCRWLTPAQARQMADVLVGLADILDPEPISEKL